MLLGVDLQDPPATVSEFLASAREDFDEVYAYPAVGGYLIAQNTRRWDLTFKPGMFERDRLASGGTPTRQTIMRGGGFRFWTQSQMSTLLLK